MKVKSKISPAPLLWQIPNHYKSTTQRDWMVKESYGWICAKGGEETISSRGRIDGDREVCSFPIRLLILIYVFKNF